MKLLKLNERATRFEQALINLQIKWSGQDVGVRPGATSKQFADFEARHGVRIPDELRRVYSTLDGFAKNSKGDDELFVLWPLNRIQRLNDLPAWKDAPDNSSRRFVFADWCIDAWFYSVEMTTEPSATSPVFIDYSPDSIKRTTGTIADFFVRYADGDASVLY